MASVDFLVPPHDDSEDVAGDVAFEAANCLELRVSGCDPSCDVILCACIQSKPPDIDYVDGTVRRAIPTLFNLCRTVFPEEAGTGLPPHNAAKLASDFKRTELSPAVSSNCAALFTPIAV